MRIEEALRIAPYARKPTRTMPDMRTGRPTVEKWVVLSRQGYFGSDPLGIQLCYPDMVPMMQLSWNDAMGFISGAEDWEPYPGRYVIDFRRRYMQIDPPLGWKPIKF